MQRGPSYSWQVLWAFAAGPIGTLRTPTTRCRSVEGRSFEAEKTQERSGARVKLHMRSVQSSSPYKQSIFYIKRACDQLQHLPHEHIYMQNLFRESLPQLMKNPIYKGIAGYLRPRVVTASHHEKPYIQRDSRVSPSPSGHMYKEKCTGA